MTQTNLKGIFAAAVTPLTADGPTAGRARPPWRPGRS